MAIGEVDGFEDIAAVKLLVASSGAVENLTILEMIDMNSIANKAAAIAGAYRAPRRIATLSIWMNAPDLAHMKL